MQVSIPDSLKLFRTSHFVRGKCRVELDASTGIVMDQQERTTTRVYGDNRGVGSTVSVDQALWLKFENGKEQCIDFPNTDIYLSRPGHKITFISATNQLDPKKYNAYIAFYNHATDKLHYYFYSHWNRVLYRKSLLAKVFNWRFLFIGIFIFAIVVWSSKYYYCYNTGPASSTCDYLLNIVTNAVVKFLPIKTEARSVDIFLGALGALGVGVAILATLTDRRYNHFEDHLKKIVEDFRKQLKES